MAKKINTYNAITALLIIITIPLGEISQYLPHYYDAAAHPLFPLCSDKMQWAWYYHFVIRGITWLMVMSAVVRIASLQTSFLLYRTCKVYFFYRLADLLAFMLFKSMAPWYSFVYVFVAFYAIYQYLQYLKDEKTINSW